MNLLDLLRTFVRVHELASFTGAADSLGLPRSTVSEQIRALEQRLGTRLLQRTTRRVQPTQDGQLLYERCRDMLDQVDEVEGLFREGSSLTGRLRIDLPVALARNLVMPRLGEFLDRHPALEMEVSATDRRVDLVREGFDCVLRIGEVSDTGLVARRLGSYPLVNCASPAYLEAHGTPRTLDDLADHQLIHYVSVLGARSAGFEYEENGRTLCLPMRGRVTVNNSDGYKEACLGGFGLIQVPLAGVCESLERGELQLVLPDHVPAPMSASLLYAHRRNLPRRVRAFMDWLGSLIEQDLAAANALAQRLRTAAR
ncbi:LysR family transcriptional regulator [Stutzerimonas nosocomialis]|uniref:LysR family transcriptional regulator n=1 Tax=Stutzerimonas nosocomialis TaxID=1056496 RepID=UPI001108C337|nr:LysR family transcriptional regulator [Stutzerimonas nosocomialis]TLX57720.1 LysR family transcriptional regulator [Stutzerimonas nosocomialis]TLX59091.1 LysR family transcriptional regulator [Stutzerimonas nosocomialis]